MFEKWGVDRGASRGGNFTGVACLISEDEIEDIMSDIEDLLLVDGNGNEEEIKEMCGAYRIHFLLLLRMFFLALSSRADMSNTVRREIILSQLEKLFP